MQDVIRGEVSWNTDTLGDFVILRSNGLPVYNFCGGPALPGREGGKGTRCRIMLHRAGFL